MPCPYSDWAVADVAPPYGRIFPILQEGNYPSVTRQRMVSVIPQRSLRASTRLGTGGPCAGAPGLRPHRAGPNARRASIRNGWRRLRPGIGRGDFLGEWAVVVGPSLQPLSNPSHVLQLISHEPKATVGQHTKGRRAAPIFPVKAFWQCVMRHQD
jgi:hypothetical protein